MADALAASEQEAHANTVDLLEENLESARARIVTARDARRLTMAEEAMKITAAIAGTRITGIAAAVEHAAAPVMSGTIPGTPATAVADLETAGGAATVNGWNRGNYSAADEGAGTADTIVLYTNIEAPGTLPFSGEGGKYSAANGLDADGNLPIVSATDATLIVSASFPDGPGIRTHAADAAGTAQVTGSFDGAPGTYVCTPTPPGVCQSSIKHGGGIDLTVGDAGWKFVPAQGATVPTPDDEYQYFGWWLRDTERQLRRRPLPSRHRWRDRRVHRSHSVAGHGDLHRPGRRTVRDHPAARRRLGGQLHRHGDAGGGFRRRHRSRHRLRNHRQFHG